jgi:hypothetical protein
MPKRWSLLRAFLYGAIFAIASAVLNFGTVYGHITAWPIAQALTYLISFFGAAPILFVLGAAIRNAIIFRGRI